MVLLACCSVVLAQCTAAPLGRCAVAFDDQALLDPSFRQGLGILSGFDEPRASFAWQPDDWVLLGVKVTHGDDTDIWFVRMSTLEQVTGKDPPHEALKDRFTIPFSAGSVRQGSSFLLPLANVRVECFDRSGKRIDSSVRTIPQYFPTATLFDACRALLSPSIGASDEPLRRFNPSDAVVTLAGTLQAIGSTRALKPIRAAIREHVVKEPNVLGLALAAFRVNLEANLAAGELVQTPWSGSAALAPRYDIKTPLAVSGQRIFDCRLVIAPPNPPYHLTAGVLMLEAVHPDKPGNRLSVRMLAAKQMPRTQLARSR